MSADKSADNFTASPVASDARVTVRLRDRSEIKVRIESVLGFGFQVLGSGFLIWGLGF